MHCSAGVHSECDDTQVFNHVSSRPGREIAHSCMLAALEWIAWVKWYGCENWGEVFCVVVHWKWRGTYGRHISLEITGVRTNMNISLRHIARMESTRKYWLPVDPICWCNDNIMEEGCSAWMCCRTVTRFLKGNVFPLCDKAHLWKGQWEVLDHCGTNFDFMVLVESNGKQMMQVREKHSTLTEMRGWNGHKEKCWEEKGVPG